MFIYLRLAITNWYACRNSDKNVTVIIALIVMLWLFALTHIYTGATSI
ncbi:hypothetical protein ACFLUS_02350 [Chloroflexota bacterium]